MLHNFNTNQEPSTMRTVTITTNPTAALVAYINSAGDTLAYEVRHAGKFKRYGKIEDALDGIPVEGEEA